jgi:hypothetical protein
MGFSTCSDDSCVLSPFQALGHRRTAVSSQPIISNSPPIGVIAPSHLIPETARRYKVPLKIKTPPSMVHQA